MNTERKPCVFVIILNYNGGDLTQRCIESLKTITYQPCSIVLVDNGSIDGSENQSVLINPEITLIRSEQNLGYTGGNNLGIRYALDHGADFVLVMNNDTEVINPNFLESLVSYGQGNPNAGALGPKVYLHRKGQIQNTLCVIPYLFKTLVRWPLQKLDWQTQASGEVPCRAEVLNGVCLFFKAAFLQDIGLFDENLFMYREDTDLALRARQSHWEWHYVPVESIVHNQRQVGYDYTSMVNFLLKRNAVYTFRKNGEWFNAFGFAACCVALSYARALIASLKLKGAYAHWRFAFILLKACKAALAGASSSPTFGPPACVWRKMDLNP